MFTRRLRQSTSLTAGVLAVFLAGPALAQQVQPVSEAPAQEEATQLDEIIVTGTRLRVQDYVASNPVVTVTGETLEYAGVTNITDFLVDQPALTGSTTLQDNSNAGARGSVGLNLLNLRNLGEDRTLVLIDGRRHVASSAGSSAVDTNTIPVALVQSIEVLTGGASAVYGADGVSGVVNFVMRRDFEGVDIRAQTGWSDEGGGSTSFLSGVVGHNFADGRANVTLAAEYSNTNRLASNDRYFSTLQGRETVVVNPNYSQAGFDPNNPETYQRVFRRNARYIDTSPGGSIYADINFGSLYGDPGSLVGVDFTGDGRPWTDGEHTGGFIMIGGDGTQLAAFGTDLIPGLDRYSFNTSVNVELTPNHRFFVEGKFVRTETQFQSQPSFDYSLFVPIDNPFIPEAARQAALAPDGLATPFGREIYEAYFGGTLPGPGILLARDNFDLGFILRDVERDTTRLVIGFEGDLTSNIGYEFSVNYGRTSETNTELNNRINERFYAAVDAVDEGQFLTGTPNGNIVCRSNLDPNAIPFGNSAGMGSSPFDPTTWGTTFTPGANSGCVPMNIFGDGSPSAEALAWVMTDSTSRDRIEQFVINGFITGDSTPWFSLPAGPVSFVLGGEYRREEALSIPSTEEVLADQVGYDVTWLGAGTTLRGDFDVKEVFAELLVPLVRDVPLIQDLRVEGAYRYSDYSTVGETEAWEGRLRWSVIDDLAFRATTARAVRAPNISELFLPPSQTFAILSDPCDDDNYQLGINPAVREANCRAVLGYGPNDPYLFNNISSSSIEGVIGGNPGLGAETADTFTVGLVLTPRFLSGFSLAIDYYDIELKDAIQFFSAQNIVNKCYDLPQPNQFCDLVSRNPNNSQIDYFEQFGVNVASYVARGYDLSARYVLDPADFGIDRNIGRFGFGVIAGKTEELTFTEDPSDPLSSDQTVGQARVPEWQGSADITWEWNDLLVNYGYNWTSETRRYEGVPDDFIDPRFRNYDGRSTHDLQVRYNLNDEFSIYGGVNNIGNQEPARGLSDYPASPLGRYFYVGLKASFGGIGDILRNPF